jgi:hypothetical protein
MKKFILTALLVLCISGPEAKSQCSASLNGYLSYMNQSMFEDIHGNWVNDNLLHNRLNFKTYLGSQINFTLEVRNRFMFGETVKTFPGYADTFEKDMGWADLSWNLASDSSYILNSTIDRVYLDLTLGKLQVIVGRQRINWGMNYVWNPNDIFNSYSFFDFDYVERPGSDAVRLQYYMGSATTLEFAAKVNHEEEYSLAGLIRFNLGGYDIQLLGGVLDEDEYVFGTGFSGYIGPVSLNGELSYLDPVKDNDPREAVFLGGLGMGYNTPFDLYIQLEYLYNQAAKTSGISNFSDFYYRDITLRDLSFAPHTFFANITYPVSPLINAGISAMMFPKFQGFFVGPSIDMSLRSDLDLSFLVQHFQGEFQTEAKQRATLGFLRMKWNF